MGLMFDEKIGVGAIHEVTLEQIARLDEALGGMVKCTYMDGKVVTFGIIDVSKILDDGTYVRRVWLPDVAYARVDEHRKYMLIRVGDGSVDYTNHVQNASPDDHIIPVLNFPDAVRGAIKKAFQEQGVK